MPRNEGQSTPGRGSAAARVWTSPARPMPATAAASARTTDLKVMRVSSKGASLREEEFGVEYEGHHVAHVGHAGEVNLDRDVSDVGATCQSDEVDQPGL